MELRTGARVFEITTGPDGRATGARYFDADGTVQFQPARAVILAANGIGTPRLMLLSDSERHPHGLANSSGLVGRNLMFHPCAIDHRLLRRWHRTDMAGAARQYPAVAGVLRDRSVARLRARLYLPDEPQHRTGQDGDRLHPAAGSLGRRRHHADFAMRFGNSTLLAALGEDLPEAHNRVELDPVLTDSHGIAAPKIFYRLSENSARQMAHAVANAETVMRAAGAHTRDVDAAVALRGLASDGYCPDGRRSGPFRGRSQRPGP